MSLIKYFLYILLIIANINLQLYAQEYTIEILINQKLHTILPFIAQQRLTAFREYPYLYEGNIEEENTYLSWFAKLPKSACAVAYYKSQPVGFITGTALVDFDEHFKGSITLFKEASLSPQNYYYLSEIIVLPNHRHQQLGQKLLKILENHAKNLNYQATCGVTEDHEKHPLKPSHYRSLEPLANSLGYQKSSLALNFSWPTRQPDNTIIEQDHALFYWLKDLVE